jgi:uncharacterized Fe-S cluster-containing radical SAM superfamily protein
MNEKGEGVEMMEALNQTNYITESAGWMFGGDFSLAKDLAEDIVGVNAIAGYNCTNGYCFVGDKAGASNARFKQAVKEANVELVVNDVLYFYFIEIPEE